MMKKIALPVYAKIAKELKQNIDQGVYQIGEKLPTETQLSARFGVNRHTLRRAISLLRSDGLLRVDQGRGTFVVSKPIRLPIGKRVRYNQALKAQGIVASYQLLRTIEIPADQAIASGLEISIGEPVALIERLGFANSQPISLTSSHFPLYRFPDILQRCQPMGSVSQFLRQVYGCDHLRRNTRISARLVKPEDARWLEVSLNLPILLAESVNVDQEGKVIEYGVTRLRGDRMELVFENDLSLN